MSIAQNILVREKNEFSIYDVAAKTDLLKGNAKRKIVFSKDFTLIGIIDNFTINIYSNGKFEKIFSFKLVSEDKGKKIEEQNSVLEEMIKGIKLSDNSTSDAIMLKKKIEREYIQEIDISPDNRFLISINKFQNENEPNVFIREIKSNKIILKLTRKNFNMENWPIFEWFGSSPIFCHCVGPRLEFYNAEKLLTTSEASENKTPSFVYEVEKGSESSQKSFRLRNFSLSPNGELCCVFLKSSKGDKASKAVVFQYPNFEKPIAIKALSAESVAFEWSKSGKALLVKYSVNTTKSYYMVSKLHLFTFYALSGERNGMTSKNPKMGSFDIEMGRSSLQDCSFSNKGDKFIVISYYPMRPKLFRTKDCKMIHDFGAMKCNRVIWSPNDRFVWIAGVINMSGFMYFYDMEELKCLGKNEHQGSRSYCWSSDSKFFMTAALTPWRRVDNMYKIWSFSGKLLEEKSFDNLLQCTFVPRKVGEPDVTFKPEELSAEERKFLTFRDNSVVKQEVGFSYKIPSGIEIDKTRRRSSSSMGRRGRGTKKNINWTNVKEKPSTPKTRKVFGLPEKAVDPGKKKKATK